MFEKFVEGFLFSVDGECQIFVWQFVVMFFNGCVGEVFFVYFFEVYILGNLCDLQIEVVNILFKDKELVLVNFVQMSDGWCMVVLFLF